MKQKGLGLMELLVVEIHYLIAARRTQGPRHAQGRDTMLLRLHLKATRDSLNPLPTGG